MEDSKLGEIIGNKIRKARVEAELSQADLALVLNVSSKSISAYESGRTIPNALQFYFISKVTRKTYDYFFQDLDLQPSSDRSEIITKIKELIKQI